MIYIYIIVYHYISVCVAVARYILYSMVSVSWPYPSSASQSCPHSMHGTPSEGGCGLGTFQAIPPERPDRWLRSQDVARGFSGYKWQMQEEDKMAKEKLYTFSLMLEKPVSLDVDTWNWHVHRYSSPIVCQVSWRLAQKITWWVSSAISLESPSLRLTQDFGIWWDPRFRENLRHPWWVMDSMVIVTSRRSKSS